MSARLEQRRRGIRWENPKSISKSLRIPSTLSDPESDGVKKTLIRAAASTLNMTRIMHLNVIYGLEGDVGADVIRAIRSGLAKDGPIFRNTEKLKSSLLTMFAILRRTGTNVMNLFDGLLGTPNFPVGALDAVVEKEGMLDGLVYMHYRLVVHRLDEFAALGSMRYEAASLHD